MDEVLHHQFSEIEGDHWWFQGRRRIVASVLRRYLPSGPGGRRIFDVGCGSGEMVDMLREFGTVSAIDPSADAVAHCRERFGAEVQVDIGLVPDDLPGPGAVDVVTAFDVVEHLDDDLGALRRINALLPPNGTLVVTVPALQLLWGPHDVLNHHRRRYTRARLRAQLETAGFSIERISYFNTVLFPVVAAVRLARRLRPHPSREGASDFTMPSPLVNRVLLGLLSSEAALLRVASLPIGVSIVAVARTSGQARVPPEGLPA
jgi:SAM-dependent methyltransferase